jgi:hypothetical protein
MKKTRDSGNAGQRGDCNLADGQCSHGEGRPPMHPDAETRILSLALPLEEPNRSAFIKAASEAVEKLGPNAYGPGAIHRLLAPLWRQFFHPPSETSPPNRSRAYYDDDDDDPDARALTAGRLRQTEGVRRLRYRRKRVADYAS